MSTSPLPHVLIVDDDPMMRQMLERVVRAAGYEVTVADDAPTGVAALDQCDPDVVVTDMSMPSGTGLDVLAAAHARDPTLPVIFVTGDADVDRAQRALEQGVLRYLVKPVGRTTLLAALEEACRARSVTSLSRPVGRLKGGNDDLHRVALARQLGESLSRLWMALQPIVSASRGRVVGYEALLRSDGPLRTPDRIIGAAEALGRLPELGRTIRAAVAGCVERLAPDVDVLMNLHPLDLCDDELLDPDAPIARVAPRVILEITERASLETVPEVHARIGALRALGFRIAIDDLGAGYGSLSAIALIRPDLVKLDMSLVRDVHTDPVRMQMVRSIGEMCQQLNVDWLCEGVETIEELAALGRAGVDFLQGYLLGRPVRTPEQVDLGVLAAVPRRRTRMRFSQRLSLLQAAQAMCHEAVQLHDALAGRMIPIRGFGGADELGLVLSGLQDLIDVLAGSSASGDPLVEARAS